LGATNDLKSMLPILRTVFVISFLFGCLLPNAQTRCNFFTDFSIALCRKDLRTTQLQIYHFQQLFPNDIMVQELKFLLSAALIAQRNFIEAKRIAFEVVNRKGETTGQVDFCKVDTGMCRAQSIPIDDVTELKYRSCMLLYDIYNEERKYDSALVTLKRADKDFYFFSKPLPSDYKKDLLLKYSKTYENLGYIDSAINIIAPYLLTESVVDHFLYLITKYKNLDSIRESYKNVQDSLIVEYGVVSENPIEIDERDYNGVILRKTSIVEYGRKVYWQFWGQNFLITIANDYKSHKVIGERRRRKLLPPKNNQDLKAEAENWVHNSLLYRSLYK
jgi:hypothetical protein